MNGKNIKAALFLITVWAQVAEAQETLRSLAAARGRYVGAILNSEWFSNNVIANYEAVHRREFNIVVAENEMKFDAMQPSNGQFNWTRADRLLQYAEANGMRVRGHALAWHSQVPGWIANGNWTRETLLAELKDHITTVVTRYRGRIHEWDVVNEAITDGNPKVWRGTNGDNTSVWGRIIGPDFIDSAFVWAHAADPSAELYYNDYAIEWGTGSGTKAGFLLDACRRWIQNGIPIHGVGTQTHIAIDHTGTPANTRTLARALQSMGLKLQITEIDIGFTVNQQPTVAQLATQGRLYAQFMDIFLQEPNMNSFVIWGFTDRYSWLPQSQNKYYGLILDESLNRKPAYDSLMASLRRNTNVITWSSSGTRISSSGGVSSQIPSSSSGNFSSSSVEVRAPFAGVISLPGILQVENYDRGGQSVAYNDSDPENQGNQYRTDGVDIGGSVDNFMVAWTAPGEWLEYTATLSGSGPLTFTARVASGQASGRFSLAWNGATIASEVAVPNTGGWGTYSEISGTTDSLATGSGVLRLTINASAFNIDWIRLSRENSTPLQVENLVQTLPGHWEVYTLRGQRVLSMVAEGSNFGDTWRNNSQVLPEGVYLVRRYTAQGVIHHTMLRQ